MSGNSQDAIFERWERLIEAAREDEAEVAGLAPFRAALEHAHSEAVGNRCLRDAFNVSKQETTRKLQRDLAGGRDAASLLRSFVKSMFGRKSEKLRRYGIRVRPRRPRGLRRPPRPPEEGAA